jgi:hypothetical protein
MNTRRPPLTLTSIFSMTRRMVSISLLRALTMSEFERRSATISGGRSAPPGAPAAHGGAPGATGMGTAGNPAVGGAPAPARSRPAWKSWVRMLAISLASAYCSGMIWSSSMATSTSMSLMMSSNRAMFEAESVMISTPVSRLAISVPLEEMSGRSSVPSSFTGAKRIGTICVTTSSPIRVGSAVPPTIVGTARSRAPSIGTIL